MKHIKMGLINLCIFIAGYLIYKANVWFYKLDGDRETLAFFAFMIMMNALCWVFNTNYLRGK